MCLFTKQNKPKTATKPIQCMKVVRCSEVVDGYKPFFLRFSDVVYRVGETIQLKSSEKKEFMKPGVWKFLPICSGEHNHIAYGLHAYTYGNENLIRLLHKHTERCVILECEIPEGALYYDGHSNCLHSCYDDGFLTETAYCSDALRVIREVPVSELL